ncbi:THAP domain-containing protein 2-like isoform X2 [Anoplophora glabripennis]|uniref:THAP domain-containing protein 2-like isoform X2 n=1 Tax=Anoplophora glabripennis TaxID=217634 RepID=UPI000874914C|nr:THAP domain-containing protein 2-like isoform X2 [Anoplophora glabripennis]
MVQSCAAINCVKRRLSGEKAKFHRFPKDPVQRKKWIEAMQRYKYSPSSTAVICQNHFRKDDYMVNVHGNTVLKKEAVPSIFNFPNHLSKQLKESRVLEKVSKENDNEQIMCEQHILPSSSNRNDTSSISENFQPEVQLSSQEQENHKRERLEPDYIGDFKQSDLECPAKRKHWIVSQEVVKNYKFTERFKKPN